MTEITRSDERVSREMATGCVCPCHLAPRPPQSQSYCDVCGFTDFTLSSVGPAMTVPLEHDRLIYRGEIIRSARSIAGEHWVAGVTERTSE